MIILLLIFTIPLVGWILKPLFSTSPSSLPEFSAEKEKPALPESPAEKEQPKSDEKILNDFFPPAIFNFLYKGIPLETNNEQEVDSLSVILKKDTLDISKIPKYEPKEKKKVIYQPQTLEEYIGQEKAKNKILLEIEVIKKIKPIHFLIHTCKPGAGKTTLSRIISNLLDANFIYRVAGDFDEVKNLEQILIEIANKEKYSVLVIDEIHQMSVKLAEQYLYTIMTDFEIQGRKIKPFSIIGCTTNKNVLQQKMSPFVTRFQADILLENYTIDNIITILKQYKKNLFPEYKDIPEETYNIIANNCRYTPRLAQALFEKSLIEPDIAKILHQERIVKDSLTDIDISVLRVLQEENRAIGAKTLARIVGISQKDYEEIYESFLVEMKYIIPGNRGRVIGEKGKQILKEV